VLKDIYSPLEIDEQWDQRAPMTEGDSMGAMGLMGQLHSSAEDAGGATAVIEAPTESPQAETIASESDEMPDPMSTPEADPNSGSDNDLKEADTSSDDQAASILAGGTNSSSETDADKDATPDPLDNKNSKIGIGTVEEYSPQPLAQITQPVVDVTPEPGKERVQPTSALETSELSNAGNSAIDSTEIKNDHADGDDEASLAKIPNTGLELDQAPVITLDSDSSKDSQESQAPAADTSDTSNSVMDSLNSDVENIVLKLKAEDLRLETAIADKKSNISKDEAELEDLNKQKAAVSERLVVLSQISSEKI